MREPVWLEEPEILAIHERLLGEHGGAGGLRDQGLLRSALAKPRHRRAYDTDAPLTRLAAAYASGIIGNHPFVDGNKRAGFMAAVLFLELNGHRFVASEEDAIVAVMALAARGLGEADFAQWLAANPKRR